MKQYGWRFITHHWAAGDDPGADVTVRFDPGYPAQRIAGALRLLAGALEGRRMARRRRPHPSARGPHRK